MVSDAFPTETTALADVVLPAALWGEKTGTFTNADRTVHLAEQAVAPPTGPRVTSRSGSTTRAGWACGTAAVGRSHGGRTPKRPSTPGARARGGGPATTPGCPTTVCARDRSSGRPPARSPTAPNGSTRITSSVPTTIVVRTSATISTTGAPVSAEAHAAARYDGRARLKAVAWTPPPEPPGEGYPLTLLTGRTVVHFHTRTKTGRVPALADAAPGAWAELSAEDASRVGVGDGEDVVVESSRGRIRVPLRVADIRPGAVFVPFHYGDIDGPGEAANDLTLTAWDPVSSSRSLRTVRCGCGPSARRTTDAPGDVPRPPARRRADPGRVVPARGARPPGRRRPVPPASDACRLVRCPCRRPGAARRPVRRAPRRAPERLHPLGLTETRTGGLGLLRDLHDLYQLAQFVDVAWTLVGQAARGARDEEAVAVVERCEGETTRQIDLLRTRLSQAAPQALLVAD